MNTSPLSPIHATTNHSLALTSAMERVFAVPNTELKWDHGNPIGTALFLLAMAVRSIVICHLGEDRPESKHVGITRRAFMNLKLTVAILVIAAVPLCAQAQKPSAAIVTHADARKVLENYQRRQGQDRDLLRYGQARSRDGRG